MPSRTRRLPSVGSTLLLSLLVGCSTDTATTDAGSRLEVSIDDAPAPLDSPPLADAPSADGSPISDAAACTGTAHWLDRGVCFEAPRCCTSADCPTAWGCTAEGRCVDPARLCACLSDTDCGDPPPTVCVTNDAVCGACVVSPDACPGGDGDCAAIAACIDGRCLARASPCFRAP